MVITISGGQPMTLGNGDFLTIEASDGLWRFESTGVDLHIIPPASIGPDVDYLPPSNAIGHTPHPLFDESEEISDWLTQEIQKSFQGRNT